MLGANVLVAQPLGFFSAIRQHALTLMAQRKVDRRRYLLTHSGVRFNLLANRFDCGMRTQESICKRLVLTQQT